jgi:hypothetical protein
MTHDELLARIELTLGTYISKYYGSRKDVELRANVLDSLQALRAVVKLHKPHELSDGLSYCSQCYEDNETGYRQSSFYPCLTIQAIEKELE